MAGCTDCPVVKVPTDNNVTSHLTSHQVSIDPCSEESVSLMREDNKSPDDTTLLSWVKGKPLAWDVTIVDIFAESHITNTHTTPVMAADSCGTTENDKICRLRHIFCSIAIETAGTWNARSVSLVQEIGRHITVITGELRETELLFQCPFIALQHENVSPFRTQ